MVKNNISKYTGLIWHLLMQNGQMPLKEVIENTGKDGAYIKIALGWMVRENRVKIYDDNGTTYVELNHAVYDFYY